MAAGTVPGSPAAEKGKVDITKILPLVVLVCLLGSVSCAKAPPTLTPPGTAAFQALRVGHALDAVRDIAIDAEATKLIAPADARLAVDWHSACVRVIAATPGGWKPVVLAAIEQLKTDMRPLAWQRIAIYIDLLKAVIKEAV
jgi:hypothetical protein